MSVNKFISSWFGIGYIPKGGGSVAAAFWILIWFFFPGEQEPLFQFLTICVLFIIGTYTASKVEVDWGKDSNRVVIDEILGMAIALFLVSKNWQNGFIAFLLFRFFDIFKPLGIRKLEKINGGLGVMADDFAAGVFSNLILHFVISLHII